MQIFFKIMSNSHPLFETKISNLNSSGQGIGEHKGLKVFIDLALPEETVKAELVEKKKKYGLGELVEILEKSPSRREPICPIFSTCGGCQIMHWDYEAQVLYKTEKVKSAFERIAGIKDPPISPTLPSKDPLFYRNKILLPFFLKEGKPSLGLYQKRSHAIVEVNTCYIHCPLGQKVYDSIKELMNASSLSVYCEKSKRGFLKHLLIRSAFYKNQCLIGFIVSNKKEVKALSHLCEKLQQRHPEIVSIVLCEQPKDHNVIMGTHWTTLFGQAYLEETLLGYTFRIAPDAFFQVNTSQAKVLFEKALELAQLKKTDSVLDAYCGIGMFSIFAAPFVQKVHGVECVLGAIESAKENAALNHFDHLTFQCASIEKVLKDLPKMNVVFLNPPRKGCDPLLLDALLHQKPSKIIYVSCDPATLARDVAHLVKETYVVDQIQPIDLFPQTTHVETLVLLKLKKTL